MKDITSLDDFLAEGTHNGFGPASPKEPATRPSDRKRVTAVLSFDKAMFQTESQSIVGRLRSLGAVEFQRVSSAGNPNIELHVDFPTVHKLQEFRDSQPKVIVETVVNEADVKGFTLRDEHNIEAADRALRSAKIRCDAEEGVRGEMVYSFFDKAGRERARRTVDAVIDKSKEKGWKPSARGDDGEEE